MAKYTKVTYMDSYVFNQKNTVNLTEKDVTAIRYLYITDFHGFFIFSYKLEENGIAMQTISRLIKLKLVESFNGYALTTNGLKVAMILGIIPKSEKSYIRRKQDQLIRLALRLGYDENSLVSTASNIVLADLYRYVYPDRESMIKESIAICLRRLTGHCQ